MLHARKRAESLHADNKTAGKAILSGGQRYNFERS
jgi:hypothetical protein